MFEFDPTFAAGLGIPISIVDKNGRRRLVSEQFAAMMRRSRDELLGVPWHTTTHVDDISYGNTLMQQTLSSDTLYSARRRMIRGDGVVFEALLHGLRLPHPKGRGYVIQTNMSLVTTLAEPRNSDADLLLPSDPTALLDVVQSRAAALSASAGRQNMRLLQHLLAMASAEATSELERRRPRDALTDTSGRGSVH